MTNDEKAAIVAASAALAAALPTKEAYKDLVQPAAIEVGQAVGAVVRSALRPFRSLLSVWELSFDQLDAWLVESLSDVPAEDIVEPPSNVAGGVLTGLVFANDDPDLRTLFVRLLATSMVRQTQAEAHPAFSEVIKQLTPMEARMIKAMQRTIMPAIVVKGCWKKPGEDYSKFRNPTVDTSKAELSRLFKLTPTEWHMANFYTHLDRDGVAKFPFSNVAYDNLVRLRIVNCSVIDAVANDDDYFELMTSPNLVDLLGIVAGHDERVYQSFSMGSVTQTAFGRQFVRACVKA